jgi:hypothetical protein
VAKEFLNGADVVAIFEQVRGKRMAQSVNRNAFLDYTCSALGLAEGALDATFGHGALSLWGGFAASAERWEEKARMAVSAPVLAQQIESGVGQREIAVLGAFAAVDMDHHARAIDIGDFEMECFVKA